MTREELIALACRTADSLTDNKGRLEFVFDDYGLESFAAAIATAERDALKTDAERYRWLRDTFSAAKAGAILHVNEPLMVYEKPKLGTEVRLQWYPNTPVCFLCVEHSTLDAAIDAARGET